MLKQIYKKNLTISYKKIGKGPVIVLIHGFLESKEIWNSFDLELAKKFSVLSIDLPGHGNSDLHEIPYTMCKYADSIKAVLDEENIEKAFIIGHSMGGYVSLAFAENYSRMLSGLCLFHSSPFSDNEIKKKARDQTIEKIKTGFFNDICETHVKSVYANDNTNLFNKEIEEAEVSAKIISKKSVVASILTMRDRNNRSEVIKNLEVPFLYFLGMKDNFIPKDIIQKIDMPERYKIVKLENSGHMGMIEEKEKSFNSINDFYKHYMN